MNTRMWEAPATQENLSRLKDRGLTVVGPGEGYLACGTIGPGRMSEPGDIFQAATDLLMRKPPKSRS